MHFSVPIELPPKKLSYDWSDVYFLAEAEQSSFNDAKIITLKQEFRNLIYQQALDCVLKKYPNWGYTDNKRAENFLRKTERDLLKGCNGSVREFIEIIDDGTIKIVVDVDDINSGECVDKALGLYSMYRGNGREEFGKPVKFNPSQFDFNEFTEDEYLC